MRWCRIDTDNGPAHGLVEDAGISLVDGTPFGAWRKTGKTVLLADAKWLVPVVPPVFYAIGSNYRDHVVKMAEAFGRKPVFYNAPRVGYRANNALLPHHGVIVKPSDASEEFQYEAELVAVIGKPGRNLTRQEAAACIFGYTIGNDVSERGWQAQDQTNIRAKNCDTFKPMGPWIAQNVDPAGMRTIVRLNGEVAHDFATGDMLFDAPAVVAEISKYNSLGPGDVVWLGTDDKPRNMKAGDELEIEITGIGVLKNSVAAG